ncbi:MAG: hypothetical protein AABY83_00530 [Pseudomonadota bacterium]
MRNLVLIIVAAVLQGCATLVMTGVEPSEVTAEACAAECGFVPRVYSGSFRLFCEGRLLVRSGSIGLVMLPGSVLYDTAVLPYTIIDQLHNGNFASKSVCEQWRVESVAKPLQKGNSKKEVDVLAWHYSGAIEGQIASQYTGDISTFRDKIAQRTNSKGWGFRGDFVGIYLPMRDKKSMFGFHFFSGGDDYYKKEYFDQLYYTYSAQYYVIGTIGNGWYVRGDIGRATLHYPDSTNATTQLVSSGMTYLLGAGYAFPVWKSASLMITATHSTSRYGVGDINQQYVGVGLLY